MKQHKLTKEQTGRVRVITGDFEGETGTTKPIDSKEWDVFVKLDKDPGDYERPFNWTELKTL